MLYNRGIHKKIGLFLCQHLHFYDALCEFYELVNGSKSKILVRVSLCANTQCDSQTLGMIPTQKYSYTSAHISRNKPQIIPTSPHSIYENGTFWEISVANFTGLDLECSIKSELAESKTEVFFQLYGDGINLRKPGMKINTRDSFTMNRNTRGHPHG